MLRYDLHSHSTSSDGTFSPTEVVHKAHAAGIDFFALTDHDTIDGVAEAKEASKNLDITLIHGVEISTNHMLATSKRGMSVHIVGLDFHDLEMMNNDLQIIQNERETRAIQICEKLYEKLNVDIYPQVLALAAGNPRAIARSHIAKVMVDTGIVARNQIAFDKFLAQGKSAYVPIETIGIHDAITMIHKAGGKAVLAHPTGYRLSGMNMRRLIGDFARLGGDAVELPFSTQSPATRGLIDRCVEIHKLRVSLGSDFHGENIPWRKLGLVPKLKEGQVGIWEDFR